MSDASITLLYVPIDSMETAESCAQVLLAEKHAVCVNVFPVVHSYYLWEGKIAAATEAVLVIKTLTSHQKGLIKRLQAIHPYDTPVILPIPVEEAPTSVQRWLQQELT